jgi:hypothetical protein
MTSIGGGKMDQDVKFAIDMLSQNDWECETRQTQKGELVKGCVTPDGETKLKIRELKTGISLLIQ